MKRQKYDNFEEDMSYTESKTRNEKLKSEFEKMYKMNCSRSGKVLSNLENSKMFMSGSITRLLLPPRTHYADCLKRVSNDLYVQIKK